LKSLFDLDLEKKKNLHFLANENAEGENWKIEGLYKFKFSITVLIMIAN